MGSTLEASDVGMGADLNLEQEEVEGDSIVRGSSRVLTLVSL